MNYGMNAAGQMQPADENQYDVLVNELQRDHTKTQSVINNQQQQLQQQAMMMQQMKQQMAMNTQQMFQGQQPQQNNQWNNNSGGGSKKKNKKGGQRGGNNQPSWKGSNNSNRWTRDAFPPNVRSDDTEWYCWTRGHDIGHNSGKCKSKCAGHQDGARSHLVTGGNPVKAEQTIFPAQMGLIGLGKYKMMRSGAPPALPTWNQGANMANMGMTMQPPGNMGMGMPFPHQTHMSMGMPMMPPTMQWQHPGQQQMQQQMQQQTQQTMHQQQQQPQFAGMAMPSQFNGATM